LGSEAAAAEGEWRALPSSVRSRRPSGQHTTPSTFEELEQMDTAALEELVRKGA
jgi:hypothetical protein